MDKDFFIREIDACSSMLYRVAYTILRNDDLCQDALQDTALKAWEKRNSLREERYFRTWITRILINTWNVICQGQIYPISYIMGKIEAAAHLCLKCAVFHNTYAYQVYLSARSSHSL